MAKNGMSARAVAATALQKVVIEKCSLDRALSGCVGQLERERDGALTQELCYGVMRWKPQLEEILRCLLKKALKRDDSDIHCLLLLGLYQLIYMRSPAHAAVNETVSATKSLGKVWAKSLVNGVLRSYQRKAQLIQGQIAGKSEAATAHPAWLLKQIKAAWPDAWQAIVAANNSRPPMTLRVNGLRQKREAYLEAVAAAGLSAQPVRHAPDGIVLDQPTAVVRLPGFAAGWVSVQDAAAQLAAPLLDLQSGVRVLDACAAPGGKTGHILEQPVKLEQLVAVDADPKRLLRVTENLQRLIPQAVLKAEIVVGDATEPQSWWDGRKFDRILLDAPCSGTGVIRRHPDIKFLRRPSDIPTMVEKQRRLLQALWPLLRSGGMLLYATCSILPCENEGQITAFLQSTPDACEKKIGAEWGISVAAGRQILPGEDGMDGFYYAALQKE